MLPRYTLSMSYLSDSYDALKRFEGVIPWMYADSVGLVTVGVGFMIPDAGTAAQMPFTEPASGLPSDPGAVTADFYRVKALPSNKSAGFYHSFPSPLLPKTAIDSMLAAKVNNFEVGLRRIYPYYDMFPDAAKVGLIDMAYNLGSMSLQGRFPKFNAAVNKHDWLMASAECHRNGPSDERNTWCANQFLEASNA